MNSFKFIIFVVFISTIVRKRLVDACPTFRTVSPSKNLEETFFKSIPVEQICFNGLGCFPTSFPFDDLPPPEDPQKIPPTYLLIELNGTKDGIAPKQISQASELNVTDLIVIIHGWASDYNNTVGWNAPISLAFFQLNPNAHILYVDWMLGASLAREPITGFYSQPASNTRSVAAAVVKFLESNSKFNITQSHCVGFSLGAHVCGFMSKRAKQKWGRLSAIDPAGPLFNTKHANPEARVDKSDALFVDVLHTSRVGITNFPVGHVEFYVNDFMLQPGCEEALVPPGSPVWVMGQLLGYFMCGHERAPRLFAATINPSGPNCESTFRFCPCADGDVSSNLTIKPCSESEMQLLGYNSYKFPDRKGSFCGLVTANKAPFC